MTQADRDEERRKLSEHAKKLYEETSRWSSDKLRSTFAQPERVKAAEERERRLREGERDVAE